ncbi:hypothetical protein DIPPA_04092 [Diplonema papillatum]|nr:hypothetical protein DIPPA_05741 [Diplonema papillatum]KAJ9442015.1 hypothetical protein DIPPA_04092 [Diplonema papillatum]
MRQSLPDLRWECRQRGLDTGLGEVLWRFYRDTNPAKLTTIPDILEEWRGAEDDLLRALQAKYGKDAVGQRSDTVQPSPAADAGDPRRMLTGILHEKDAVRMRYGNSAPQQQQQQQQQQPGLDRAAVERSGVEAAREAIKKLREDAKRTAREPAGGIALARYEHDAAAAPYWPGGATRPPPLGRLPINGPTQARKQRGPSSAAEAEPQPQPPAYTEDSGGGSPGLSPRGFAGGYQPPPSMPAPAPSRASWAASSSDSGSSQRASLPDYARPPLPGTQLQPQQVVPYSSNSGTPRLAPQRQGVGGGVHTTPTPAAGGAQGPGEAEIAAAKGRLRRPASEAEGAGGACAYTNSTLERDVEKLEGIVDLLQGGKPGPDGTADIERLIDTLTATKPERRYPALAAPSALSNSILQAKQSPTAAPKPAPHQVDPASVFKENMRDARKRAAEHRCQELLADLASFHRKATLATTHADPEPPPSAPKPPEADPAPPPVHDLKQLFDVPASGAPPVPLSRRQMTLSFSASPPKPRPVRPPVPPVGPPPAPAAVADPAVAGGGGPEGQGGPGGGKPRAMLILDAANRRNMSSSLATMTDATVTPSASNLATTLQTDTTLARPVAPVAGPIAAPATVSAVVSRQDTQSTALQTTTESAGHWRSRSVASSTNLSGSAAQKTVTVWSIWEPAVVRKVKELDVSQASQDSAPGQPVVVWECNFDGVFDDRAAYVIVVNDEPATTPTQPPPPPPEAAGRPLEVWYWIGRRSTQSVADMAYSVSCTKCAPAGRKGRGIVDLRVPASEAVSQHRLFSDAESLEFVSMLRSFLRVDLPIVAAGLPLPFSSADGKETRVFVVSALLRKLSKLIELPACREALSHDAVCIVLERRDPGDATPNPAGTVGFSRVWVGDDAHKAEVDLATRAVAVLSARYGLQHKGRLDSNKALPPATEEHHAILDARLVRLLGTRSPGGAAAAIVAVDYDSQHRPQFTPCASGSDGPLDWRVLQSSAVYLLIHAQALYIWVGGDVHLSAMTRGLHISAADVYISQNALPPDLPLVLVVENGEPPSFDAIFR